VFYPELCLWNILTCALCHQGTAEVVFTRKPDAIAAVKRYNNVQLDGKPMKIELIGTNLNSAPVAPAVRAMNGALAVVAARGRAAAARVYVILSLLNIKKNLLT
jgi:hypothetical protein